MAHVKGLVLTVLVLFSSILVFETPISVQSEASASTSTYLYSIAHLSEPEVDGNGGQNRIYFQNQTEWLAHQPNIKAVVITGGFMGYNYWYNITTGTVNATVWGWVKEGIYRLRNAGKVVIPVLGDHDAFYNESYDSGSDYRAFLNYTGVEEYIGVTTPNYTVTLNETIKLFFVALTYRFGPSGFEITDDQVSWLSNQLNSTSLPAIIALHSPPTKYASSLREIGINDAVWAEASRHSNVFLILHGHDFERNFRIYEARDGHPIYVEGKLIRWSSGGQAEIQLYDVYSDRVKSYTFSPWLNRYFTGFEGDTFEIPFRGIMKSKSGLLKRNDFSSRLGSETGVPQDRIPRLNYDDFISPPSSVDFGYNDMVKRLLSKYHKTFWLQTYRKFAEKGLIRFTENPGANQNIPLKSYVNISDGNYYFYPNASDTSKNVTVSTSDWYSVIYSINETAETVDVYLFLENSTLVRSWSNLSYISMKNPYYVKKYIDFFEYVRMDDYIVTNETKVTLPPGTILTLSNGTLVPVPDGSLNLLDFGTLVLMNVTVQIGMESKVMDLYGGDAVIVGYLDFWPSPVALFTYQPSIPLVNKPVAFNASDSKDPNGWVVNYTWDFGDGTLPFTVENITDTTPWLINHTFTKQGTYLVTLTLTDNEGLNSFKTIRLDVVHAHDIAITGVLASPQTVILGESVSVKVSVTNEGVNNEGGFIVTAFYNATAFKAKVVSLNAGKEKNLIFIWNTTDVAAGTYNMSAQVTGVEGEIDFGDNIYVGNTVTVERLNSTVSIYVSPQVLKVGENVTITGEIFPLRIGANVTIMYRRPGQNWSRLVNVLTDTNGWFRYDWVPQVGRSYVKAIWTGDDQTWGNASIVLLIIVYKMNVSQDEAPLPNYLMYAIVGTAIAIIAIAALLYFVKARKRPQTHQSRS